jgi:hypothetical protein
VRGYHDKIANELLDKYTFNDEKNSLTWEYTRHAATFLTFSPFLVQFEHGVNYYFFNVRALRLAKFQEGHPLLQVKPGMRESTTGKMPLMDFRYFYLPLTLPTFKEEFFLSNPDDVSTDMPERVMFDHNELRKLCVRDDYESYELTIEVYKINDDPLPEVTIESILINRGDELTPIYRRVKDAGRYKTNPVAQRIAAESILSKASE